MKRRPRTLPEKERTDSSEKRISITGVDKAAHTIYAQFNGYKITAVCRERSDPEIYDRIKGYFAQQRFGKAGVNQG